MIVGASPLGGGVRVDPTSLGVNELGLSDSKSGTKIIYKETENTYQTKIECK